MYHRQYAVCLDTGIISDLNAGPVCIGLISLTLSPKPYCMHASEQYDRYFPQYSQWL